MIAASKNHRVCGPALFALVAVALATAADQAPKKPAETIVPRPPAPPALATPAEPNTARGHLSRAIRLLRQGRWQDAVAECEKAEAAAAQPHEKVDAALTKARALWVGGRYRASAAEYRRAASMPAANDYQRLEAWRGAMRAAAAARDPAAEREAIEALLKMPRISDPERARLLTRLGELLLQDGDEARALALFADVAKRFPREYAASQARRHILAALIRAGKTDAALAMLRSAREEKWPGAEDLHLRAAQLLSLSGAEDMALRVYEELLAWRPAYEPGWRAAWRAFHNRGLLDRRLSSARAAAARDLDAARAVGGMAESMGLDDDPAVCTRAMALYRELLKILPDDPRLLRGAARLSLRLGDLPAADRYSVRLIQLAPRDMAAQLVRAEVLARQGKTDQALSFAQRAAQFQPQNVSSARRLVSLLSQIGLYDAVPSVVAQVRQATGNRATLATEMARFYARQSKWGAAVDELATAVATGEASARYAQLIVRSWMTDITVRDEVVQTLARRYRDGSLPPELLPAYVYALVTSGDIKGAKRVLEGISKGRARAVASEVLKWGAPVSSEGRKLLYQVSLGGQMDPVSEARLAQTLADDLAAAGDWHKAAEVLRRHHKPGLPAPMARDYEVRFGGVLVRIGDLEGAKKVAARWAMAGDPGAAVVMARCAMAEGDYEAAERWAKAAVAAGHRTPQVPDGYPAGTWGVLAGTSADPPAASATLVLADCALRRLDLDTASQTLRQVIEKWPESQAATEAVARLALVAQVQGLPEGSRRVVVQGLQALDRGEVEEAERLFAQCSSRSRELAAQLELMVAQALAARDRRAALRRLEDIAERYDDPGVAAYALYLAARLSQADEPATARRLAQRLLKDHPDSALVPVAERLLEQMRDRGESR